MTGLVVEQPLFNADAWLGAAAAAPRARPPPRAERWTRRTTAVDVVRAYFGAVLAGGAGDARSEPRPRRPEPTCGRPSRWSAREWPPGPMRCWPRSGPVRVEARLLERRERGPAGPARAGHPARRSRRHRLDPARLAAPAEQVRARRPAGRGRHRRVRLVPTSRAAAPGRRAAEADARRAAALYLPRLNGFGRLDWNSPDAPFGGQSAWTLGLMLCWSPFAGRARNWPRSAAPAAGARRPRAMAEAAAAQAALETRPAAGPADWWRSPGSRSPDAGVAQAPEAHRIVARKYDGGLATVGELLDAAAVETATRLGDAAARYEVIVAMAELPAGARAGSLALLDLNGRPLSRAAGPGDQAMRILTARRCTRSARQACGRGGDARPPRCAGAPDRSIGRTLAVRETTITATFEAAGIAEPIERATLSTRLMGSVTAVLVREGDRVRPGQLLARIDARDMEAKRAQVEAGIAAAEAMYQRRRDPGRRASGRCTPTARRPATSWIRSETGLARAEAGLRHRARRPGRGGGGRRLRRDPRAVRRDGDPAASWIPVPSRRPARRSSRCRTRRRLRISVTVPPRVAQRLRARAARSTPRSRAARCGPRSRAWCPAAGGAVYTVNADRRRTRPASSSPGSAATLLIPDGRRTAILVPATALRARRRPRWVSGCCPGTVGSCAGCGSDPSRRVATGPRRSRCSPVSRRGDVILRRERLTMGIAGTGRRSASCIRSSRRCSPSRRWRWGCSASWPRRARKSRRSRCR